MAGDRTWLVSDEDLRSVLRVFAAVGRPVDMYTVIDQIQAHRRGDRIDGRTRAGKAFHGRRLDLVMAVFEAYERGYLVLGERMADATTVTPAGLRYLGSAGA